MGGFVNIKNADEEPLFVNMKDISVIVECTEKRSKQDKETLCFHSLDQGCFFSVNLQGREQETDAVVNKIQNSGTDLFALPFCWGDDREIGRYFVNPALVQSVIVSGECTDGGKTEPHVGLLADVKGYGRVETYRVPVSTVEAFVKAVEAVNPHLMRFDSEQASTRWGPEGYTMIDQSEIESVFPNGWDMDIRFNDGARLDFHLDRGKKVSQASNEYLHRLIKKIQGNGTREDLRAAVGGDLNVLMPRLARYEDRYRKRLREGFAAAVTANMPDIVKIQNAQDVYYAKLDRVAWIAPYAKVISIHFEKAANRQYADDMSVYFDNEQAALSEMERLVSLMNEVSPRPLKKAL